jgi:hypothetical protein
MYAMSKIRALPTLAAVETEKFRTQNFVVGYTFDDKVSGQRFFYHGVLTEPEKSTLFVKAFACEGVHLQCLAC